MPDLPDHSAAPTALPPVLARIVGFAAIVVAACCGGLIGWAVVDLQCRGDDCQTAGVLGAAVGALAAGVGVGVIVVLVLRAMSEWREQAPVRRS